MHWYYWPIIWMIGVWFVTTGLFRFGTRTCPTQVEDTAGRREVPVYSDDGRLMHYAFPSTGVMRRVSAAECEKNHAWFDPRHCAMRQWAVVWGVVWPLALVLALPALFIIGFYVSIRKAAGVQSLDPGSVDG